MESFLWLERWLRLRTLAALTEDPNPVPSSQPPVAPVPGDPTLFDLHRHLCIHTQLYTQTGHTPIIKSKNKSWFAFFVVGFFVFCFWGFLFLFSLS